MVKLRELTNQELMQKLEKYITLNSKLENERQRRIQTLGEIDELLTSDEKKHYDQQASKDITQYRTMDTSVDLSSFQINFNDEELQKIQETCKQEISDAKKLETITNILRLSDLNLEKES